MWPFRKNDKSETIDGTLIVAQLNARVQPLDRFDYFEEPLQKALEAAELGKVTGGGTQLVDDPNGIEYCDVEILLNVASEDAVNAVISKLEAIGAPKGSLLKGVPDRSDIPFGVWEGLGLFLNGVDLPDEVYQSSDVNDVIAEIDKLLEGNGEFRGHWQGNLETALYFYGTSFALMQEAVNKVIIGEPLCEKCRIEQIA
ncbi:MAG: hypothetical protein AAF198_03915 [Pseudomonadota bacterium]